LSAAGAVKDADMPSPLAQVIARPDDDGPRLVFADWLDDHADHPRADFIRVQLALARLPDRDRRRTPLADREHRLLARFGPAWTAPLAGLATAPVFRRGFVHAVNQPARQFLTRGDDLFALAPVRELHLLDLGGHHDAVFDSPHLGRLAGLTVFAQHQGEPLAAAVAGCPHLGGLRRLDLGRNEIGCDGLQRLADSPHLAAVEELDLAVNHIDGRGVRYAAERAAWPELRRLELADNMLGAAAVERLVRSDRLPKLHRLGLSGNRLWSYQRDSLPERTALLRVPVLDLRNNGLTADGLRVLLGTSAGGVRELDLSMNRLRDEGVCLLATAEVLGGLRVLKLAANDVGDEGLRALATSPHLSRLAVLDVSNNPVGDDGVRAVVESRHLTALRQFVYPTLGLSFRLRLALRARYEE
jgi:uncharacterized protein (TIGR02996 family)